MIWADRIGVGFFALVLLGFTILYGVIILNNRAVDQAVESTVPKIQNMLPLGGEGAKNFVGNISNNPFSDKNGNRLLRDSDVGIFQNTPASDLGHSLLIWLVFFNLPAWIALRVVDFMFGGPQRRRLRLRAGG